MRQDVAARASRCRTGCPLRRELGHPERLGVASLPEASDPCLQRECDEDPTKARAFPRPRPGRAHELARHPGRRVGGANGSAELNKMQILQVRLGTRSPSGPPGRPGKFRGSAGLTRIGVAPASCGDLVQSPPRRAAPGIARQRWAHHGPRSARGRGRSVRAPWLRSALDARRTRCAAALLDARLRARLPGGDARRRVAGSR